MLDLRRRERRCEGKARGCKRSSLACPWPKLPRLGCGGQVSNPLHRPGLTNSIFLEGHGRGREWLFANARRTSYSQARHAAQCNHQPDRGGRQSGPQQPRHHHARQGAERGALVSHARRRVAGTLGIGLQTVTGKWKVEGGGSGDRGPRACVLAADGLCSSKYRPAHARASLSPTATDSS